MYVRIKNKLFFLFACVNFGFQKVDERDTNRTLSENELYTNTVMRSFYSGVSRRYNFRILPGCVVGIITHVWHDKTSTIHKIIRLCKKYTMCPISFEIVVIKIHKKNYKHIFNKYFFRNSLLDSGESGSPPKDDFIV